MLDNFNYNSKSFSNYSSFALDRHYFNFSSINNLFSWKRYFSSDVLVVRDSPTPNNYQKQVIVGLLLGDGCIKNPNQHKRSSGNSRLVFTFKSSTLNFIKWLKFEILGSISTKTLPTPWPANNPSQYWFSCKCLPYFTYLDSIWYRYCHETGNRKKILPPRDYFDKYFTAASLAHWIMGDGYWAKTNKTIILCTESFTQQEIEFLIDFLQTRFNLIASKQIRVNQGWRIRFSAKGENITRLRSLIEPHMHSEMLYKLNIKI